MTAIEAALVNANLLAILCMETFLVQETIDIRQRSNGHFCEVYATRQVES